MTTATTSTGRFVWFEYVSKDLPRAQGFFGELFGWTTKSVPMPDGAYTMIAAADGKTIGGYSEPPSGAVAKPAWLPYLLVDSAAKTAAKVAQLGGTIMKDAFKVGDFATMAVVLDPQGAAVALWQPAKPEDAGEAAVGHFTWNELPVEGSGGVGSRSTSRSAGSRPRPWRWPGWGRTTCSRAAARAAPGSWRSRCPIRRTPGYPTCGSPRPTRPSTTPGGSARPSWYRRPRSPTSAGFRDLHRSAGHSARDPAALTRSQPPGRRAHHEQDVAIDGDHQVMLPGHGAGRGRPRRRGPAAA